MDDTSLSGGVVNVELTPAAEISAEVGGAAEIRVELTPAAEISVELTPDAEIGVTLEDGPTVAVQLAGGAELNFLPDGALDHYYEKTETDALLAAKADAATVYSKAQTDTMLAGKAAAVHDHDDRYYTEAETDALLALRVARAALLDLVYPVGAIYMSVGATDPGELFGGTWARIKDTFLLAAGDTYAAGATGGEAAVALDNVKYLPAHTHGSKSLSGSVKFASGRFGGSNTASGIMSINQSATTAYFATTSSGSVTNMTGFGVNATHEHNSVGSGEAHNNMPPYLAVYVWQRTA